MKRILARLTTADIILSLALIVFSLTLIASRLNISPGGKAKVFIDNQLASELDLSVNKIYIFQGVMGAISIKVSAGTVKVYASNCPLKLCLKRGRISKVGQSILCLPNKVFIVVVEGKPSRQDGVTG